MLYSHTRVGVKTKQIQHTSSNASVDESSQNVLSIKTSDTVFILVNVKVIHVPCLGTFLRQEHIVGLNNIHDGMRILMMIWSVSSSPSRVFPHRHTHASAATATLATDA